MNKLENKLINKIEETNSPARKFPFYMEKLCFNVSLFHNAKIIAKLIGVQSFQSSKQKKVFNHKALKIELFKNLKRI